MAKTNKVEFCKEFIVPLMNRDGQGQGHEKCCAAVSANTCIRHCPFHNMTGGEKSCVVGARAFWTEHIRKKYKRNMKIWKTL